MACFCAKLPESHGGKGETFFFQFGGKLAVFLATAQGGP